MRRYASLSLSLLLTVALLLVVALGCSRPAHAQGNPTDAQVRQIITRMGDNRFPERQKASAEMDDLIKKNLLTPAQLGILRTMGAGNADPEIRHRANRALTTWSNTFPAANQIFTSSRLMSTRFDPVRGDHFYDFDSLYGVAGNAAQKNTLAQLAPRSEAVRNAMANGDPAAVKQALTDLKNFVNNNFNNMDLYKNNNYTNKPTKQEVLDKIQGAIDAADTAAQQIGQGAGNAPPPPRQMVPMNGMGAVNGTGTSLMLTLLDSNPAPGGSVDIFMPPYAFAMSLPPDGQEFIGPVFDIMAVDSLNITGAVRVGLAYDDTLFSSSTPDIEGWQLVRITMDGIETLSNLNNDTTNFILSGEYTPASASSGADQFGEFAIVRAAQSAAPEPKTVLFVVVGGFLAYSGSFRRPRC